MGLFTPLPGALAGETEATEMKITVGVHKVQLGHDAKAICPFCGTAAEATIVQGSIELIGGSCVHAFRTEENKLIGWCVVFKA